MTKTVAVIQARMGSTRLPGKVLRDMGWMGSPTVLDCVISAALAAHGVDEVWVATSTEPADIEIVNHVILRSAIDAIADRLHVLRGSETDVLGRFWAVAEASNADVLLRLTADCPFIDPSVIAQVIALRDKTDSAYASCIDPPTWPDGLDVECFTRYALECAHAEATRPSDRDCVTRFIVRNRAKFKAANLTCPIPGLHKERWVLDTEDDYKFCCEVAKRLTRPMPSYLEILSILDKEPELRKINAHHPRNERFYDGISTEPLGERKYGRSAIALGRAFETNPLGAQTFSKSYKQYGDFPLYASHGDGAYIYDLDGNDYVDLVSALLPNILGYRDPDVDAAVRRQLDSGASLSLATELEAELSEKLCEIIPCAEMVRLGKSGTDVTTAAVRLARYHTGRDLIASAGYHGWADWSVAIEPMRANGVPATVAFNTTPLVYGNLDYAEDLLTKEQVAAVIVEPETNPEYLRGLRKLCDETGTVLIFDEVICGMRWALGGAQELYGVTPDLAAFGKAIANGMPISALVGKKEIMRKTAPPDNIFYSSTFGGETLSIAAALATIKKVQEEKVVPYLWAMAGKLLNGIDPLLERYGMDDRIQVYGTPLLRLWFKDEKTQHTFIRLMADNGVLIIGSHNLTWAHKEPQLKRILTAYEATLSKMAA